MIMDGIFHAGSEWLSDLGIGETCEAFHSSGSSPSLMEMLNSSVTAGVILNAVFLSISWLKCHHVHWLLLCQV